MVQQELTEQWPRSWQTISGLSPDPKDPTKLVRVPKLVPTCQTPAGDGMKVYTKSPKSRANQKAVMEFLLINHPLDCPVCDQAGECYLQDYSYKYGRSESRFLEDKATAVQDQDEISIVPAIAGG